MKELQNYLVQGATSYLDFLERSNKGIEEISILNIQMAGYNTLLLGLERVLIGTDYLQLHTRDYVIDLDIIEEKSFNEMTRTLKLCFQDSLLQRLADRIIQDKMQDKNMQNENAKEEKIEPEIMQSEKTGQITGQNQNYEREEQGKNHEWEEQDCKENYGQERYDFGEKYDLKEKYSLGEKYDSREKSDFAENLSLQKQCSPQEQHSLRENYDSKEQKEQFDLKANGSKERLELSANSVLKYLVGDKNEALQNIKIFSDLKFLVKNIRDFCDKDSLNLKLPKKKPLPLKIELDSYISEEQKEAIKGIFTHPISYVWGISGSGKTQVVLFNCMLNIIAQNKKTLILAPTNTALEQIFIALIKQGDKKGLQRYRFLRLGMPSSDFLQNFPEVCIHPDDKEESEVSSLFKTQTLKARMQDCFVIGVTLDSFVKRYNQLCELEFAHTFLDECAFSPLIKLIAPLTLNTPVTLLGDHKQLMPICLMSEQLIYEKHHEVCAWNLSTLFLETLFKEHKTLYQRHNYEDISFNAIANYKLTTTHRYGNNLAHVLNKYVYNNGLCGVGAPTELYFIDSKGFGQNYQYNKQNPRNENLGEANAILSLVRNLSDYAVLTPFRDQQKLLVKKGVHRNNVFTIHKSQGKEFDTIVFSPVKYSKNLTDSSNRSALFALNVAVSRLKKRLIIVCDYSFWMSRQTQFITALLNNSKPYPLGESFMTKSMPTRFY